MGKWPEGVYTRQGKGQLSMRLNPRVKDYLEYIGIGLGLLVGIYLGVIYSVNVKWFTLAYWTAGLFGVMLEVYRGAQKSAKFWLVLFALVVLHTSIYIVLLSRFSRWVPAWYFVTFIPEAGLFGAAIGHWTGTVPLPRKRPPDVSPPPQ